SPVFRGLERGLRGYRAEIIMSNRNRRRLVAQSHARGMENPYLAGICPIAKRFVKRVCSCHFARERIANPDSHGRRGGLPFLDDVEMSVEGRDFVDLRHRYAQDVCERGHMLRAQMTVPVLDQMQIFDEPVADNGLAAEEGLNLLERSFVNLTAARELP